MLVLVPPGAASGAAHCSTLLCPCPCLDRPPDADTRARQRAFEKDGVQCSQRQVLWCAPSLLGFVVETEPLYAPRTDRRCALYWFVDARCLCCLVLLYQAGYPVVALQEELVPGPPCLLLTVVALCVVLCGQAGAPRGQLENSCVSLMSCGLLRAQRGILTSGVEHTVLGFSGGTLVFELFCIW